MLPRLRILVATAWAGSLWTVAAVASLMFAALDKQAAGQVVGILFEAEAFLTLACAAVLALLLLASTDVQAPRKRALLALVMAMVVCTVTVQYGVHPMMDALRAANPGPLSADVRTQFGLLHAVAMLFYFAECVLAGIVVIRVR
jgi:hypothetical protein